MSRSSRSRKAKISVKGLDAMDRNLKKLAGEIGPKSYGSSLIPILRKVQASAMEKAPVDTGYLKASARAKLLAANERGALGAVYFFAPYATEVHDDHKTKSGFLTKAMLEEANKYAKDLGVQLVNRMFSKGMS